MACHTAKGKSFIITGGANGLGAGHVEAFLKEGAKNIAILDIAEEAGVALSQRLNEAYGDRTTFVKCDVSRQEDIDWAFQNVLQKFKQIDVIINNAGIMNDSEAMWRKECDINFQGLVSFTRKGLAHMRTDEGGAGGTIINVSSVAGFLKIPFLPAYGGTKAAVLHFSLSLAEPPFFERTGVRILTMCFGATRTALVENLDNKSIDKEAMNQVLEEATFQSVDSAVAAMVKMFHVGPNGSVWISVEDRAAKDITHALENSYKTLENVVNS